MLAARHLLLITIAAVSGCGSTEVTTSLRQANAPQALVAADYPARQHRDERPTASPASNPKIPRSADGLFYVRALVNGVPVRFVVDSGSSTVVLNRSDADRAGIDRGNDSALLQTAGGITRMQRTQLREVAIADRSLKNIDAAIVDDGMGVSLLGQSALSRLDSVHFSRDTLELR